MHRSFRMGPLRPHVRQKWKKFQVVSMISTSWHQHVWFAHLSGVGLLWKIAVKQFLYTQRAGSLKSNYCQSFRTEGGMTGEKNHAGNFFSFHQCKASLSKQRSACLQSSQCCPHWAGVEDTSSTKKLSCRQTLLMNGAFCVATVGPSNFLLVDRDHFSGFGISNWKKVAWAAICLFNHLLHSMHSC